MSQIDTDRNRFPLALAGLVLVLLQVLAIAAPALAADGVVNINTADEGELALLPRVGPAIAGRIVEHREANGEFAGTEELMLVRGIGEKTYALLEPYVTIDGETTLSGKVSQSEARARQGAAEDPR